MRGWLREHEVFLTGSDDFVVLGWSFFCGSSIEKIILFGKFVSTSFQLLHQGGESFDFWTKVKESTSKELCLSTDCRDRLFMYMSLIVNLKENYNQEDRPTK